MYNATLSPNRRNVFRPSKQSALIMGAIATALLSLTLGLYIWQTGEMEQINREVITKQDEVAHSERSARQLETVRQEASEVDNKLRFLEQNVSQGSFIPTMVQQMARRAQSHRLIVTSTRHNIEIPPPPQPLTREEKKEGKTLPPPPPYNKARIEIDLMGTYGNVARFIHSLTRFEKIIAVSSVMEQSREVKNGETPQLTVRLIMTGYVFPDGDGATPTKANPKLGSLSERRAMENQLLSPPASQPSKK